MYVVSVVRYLNSDTQKECSSSLICTFMFSMRISFSNFRFGMKSRMWCIFISLSDLRNRSCAEGLLELILPSDWNVNMQSLSWLNRLFMSQCELLFLNEIDVKYCPQRMARNMVAYWFHCRNSGCLPLMLKSHEIGIRKSKMNASVVKKMKVPAM